MKKIISIFLSFFISGAFAAGDDCLNYKLNPEVTINVPVWTKSVVQPLQKMDVLHGEVVATLVDEFEITFAAAFCAAVGTVGITGSALSWYMLLCAPVHTGAYNNV